MQAGSDLSERLGAEAHRRNARNGFLFSYFGDKDFAKIDLGGEIEPTR
jgi:hypothetical protein